MVQNSMHSHLLPTLDLEGHVLLGHTSSQHLKRVTRRIVCSLESRRIFLNCFIHLMSNMLITIT